MPQIPLETLGNCGGVISCYCLNVTQQCAALGYNPLYPLHKRNRLIAVVHTNSHLDDEAGASVKFATTVFVGFLWKKNKKKRTFHGSLSAVPGSEAYVATPRLRYSWYPAFFFFSVRTVSELAQTFIVSALFEHFELTDGDTHHSHSSPPVPSRPAASPPLTQPICDMCQCNVQTVY